LVHPEEAWPQRLFVFIQCNYGTTGRVDTNGTNLGFLGTVAVDGTHRGSDCLPEVFIPVTRILFGPAWMRMMCRIGNGTRLAKDASRLGVETTGTYGLCPAVDTNYNLS
jgi:hypothetical protein